MAKRRIGRRGKKQRRRKHRIPKRMPNNSLSIYKTTVMAMQDISIGQGAAGYIPISQQFALNHPTYCRDGGGTWTQCLGFPTNLARLLTVFDMYRVVKMDVIIIPSELDTKTNTTNADTADTPSVVYVYNDHDDNAAVTSENIMLNAGSYPQQFTFKSNIRKSFVNSDKSWINASLIGTNSTVSVIQGTVTIPTYYASTKVFFPLLQRQAAVTSYYGRIYVRWYVEFQGINSVS